MKKVIGALVLVLALSACDSASEKAAKQLAAARDFVSQGDVPRALIELRNALKNDETLREARVLFADLLLKQGRRKDAVGQYRYIVEKDPSDVEASRALALIAFDGMDWEGARKYADVVAAADPQDLQVQAVQVGLDYRAAAEARNVDEMERAAERAARLLKTNPELLRARRVVLADMIRRDDPSRALELVDEGLKYAPDDRDLANVRLVVLSREGDADAIEKQILSMIDKFPEDLQIGRLLVEFYLSRGRIDEAEAWLRARIKPEEANAGGRLVLLRFIAQVRSNDAVRAELAKILAEDPLPADVASDLLRFQAMKAGADYVGGDQEAAMAYLEGLLDKLEPSQEVDEVRVQLARMREGVGNRVGARAMVEQVLEHDPGQTGALKMKSGWLIEEDKTQEAVRMLRDALSDAPEDAQILTLLARAYQREGRTALMADMLARAVEVSNQAADESQRYAAWLVQNEDYRPAETVLINALRRQPDNLQLLTMLGGVHQQMQDWGRLQQDIAAIRERFDTPQGRAAADELQARLLAGQGRADELGSFLEGLAQQSDGAVGARIAVIRNTVRAGNLGQALELAQALVADQPDDPAAGLLLAQIHQAMGATDEAIAVLRKLTETSPTFEEGWSGLYMMLARAGQTDAADAALEQALVQLPKSRQLRLLRAGRLEQLGKIDETIALYDALYAENSDDPLVANNLASLLASTRSDDASLERAWTVARRLVDSKVPALQDTYGWIAFRRGELDEALKSLEPAAKGLPGDPSVAYHLGRAYAAKGMKDQAMAEYARAEGLIAQGAVAYPGLAEEIATAKAAP